MRNATAALGALLLGLFVFYACTNWGTVEDEARTGTLVPASVEQAQKADGYGPIPMDIAGIVGEYNADPEHNFAICNRRPRVMTEDKCKSLLLGKAFLGRDGYFYDLEAANKFFSASLLRVSERVKADWAGALKEKARMASVPETKGFVPDADGKVDKVPTGLAAFLPIRWLNNIAYCETSPILSAN